MPKASSQNHPESNPPPRDKHGARGLPPPAAFDVEALPGSALLNEREAGAILRVSTNTLGSWRRQSGHPLQWRALPNGFIRYRVVDIRAFLAMGQPRERRRKGADAKSQHVAPAPRQRTSRRPRAEAVPRQEAT